MAGAKNVSRLETMVNREYQKVVIIPDAHFPYEDRQTFKSVIHFVEDQVPDMVILLGDWIDNYSISKYDKNPERVSQLQEEIDRAHDGLEKVRKATKEKPIIYIQGNHEDRLQKYLWRHPEVHGLKALDLKELLGLDKLKITLQQDYFWKNTLLFTHGKRCGVYAAKFELEDNGCSGISGHTHKVMTFAKKDRGGEKVWYSMGHIADPKQAEYTNNPNWQQAIGLAYLHKSKTRFFALSIPIIEHKMMYDGKLYQPDGIVSLERGRT